VPTLWLVLLMGALSLGVLAVLLVIKLHLLSTSSLTGGQAKDVWAFVGVALGAIAALIGALLTDQHKRRTNAVTHEAAERERLARAAADALGQETEERCTIDLVARVLELITFEGGYAPKARVAGAMAMLAQRPSNGVTTRILKELWDAHAVDTDTAAWLIDRILVDGARRPDEAVAAASLLALQAAKLVPAARDSDQTWSCWPTSLMHTWPEELPESAKSDLLLAAVNVFLAREPAYWRATDKYPLETLVRALDDPTVASKGAIVLVTLHDRGALARVEFQLPPASMVRAREQSGSARVPPWLNKEITRWMEVLWVPGGDGPAQ
jgi:hypothetical protein